MVYILTRFSVEVNLGIIALSVVLCCILNFCRCKVFAHCGCLLKMCFVCLTFATTPAPLNVLLDTAWAQCFLLCIVQMNDLTGNALLVRLTFLECFLADWIYAENCYYYYFKSSCVAFSVSASHVSYWPWKVKIILMLRLVCLYFTFVY